MSDTPQHSSQNPASPSQSSQHVLASLVLPDAASCRFGAAFSMLCELDIHTLAVFQPELDLSVLDEAGRVLAQYHARDSGHAPAWLPRGKVGWRCTFSEVRLTPGRYRLHACVHERHRASRRVLAVADAPLMVMPSADGGTSAMAAAPVHIVMVALPDGIDLNAQPWQREYKDWFFRHFAHAAEVVTTYMLGDAPELCGRILDVGCGDGITDLGIALRWQPELLVGIDPFRGYQRLPDIMRASGLPEDLPACLRFEPHSANAIPYPDDSFDVVVSWGSLEHIVGGYTQALREIRRVLRPGGRFFVHPGLYYSNFGHHLGEFSNEPHFHLRWPESRLRAFVLGKQPDYMDRSGEFASSEQYWRWYLELNRITVREFEQELRYLGFEMHRAAMRVDDRVDFTPELQRFSLIDLLTNELYVSCINRKH